jgi:hypothetical protein
MDPQRFGLSATLSQREAFGSGRGDDINEAIFVFTLDF